MDTRQRRICHDLKSERADVGKPLPAILRLLPIGFYFSGIATAGLCALLGWQLRQARDARDRWKAQEADHKEEVSGLQKQSADILRETKRAEDVKKWVAGSEPMQELIVGIIRSMRPQSALSEINVARDKDDARKVGLTLMLNTGGPTQLDQTLGRLTSDLHYRPYFAQQKQEKGGSISYSATLIKQQGEDAGHGAAPAPNPPIN